MLEDYLAAMTERGARHKARKAEQAVEAEEARQRAEDETALYMRRVELREVDDAAHR